jgi:hypothetical protein
MRMGMRAYMEKHHQVKVPAVKILGARTKVWVLVREVVTTN